MHFKPFSAILDHALINSFGISAATFILVATVIIIINLTMKIFDLVNKEILCSNCNYTTKSRSNFFSILGEFIKVKPFNVIFV